MGCGCSSPTPPTCGSSARPGTGAEVVAAARELRPDVVVMDIRMPGMDGIEATRRITADTDAPHILMLTTFDDAGVATQGTRAVVEAMRATGVPRIVVVSAAPIGTVPAPDRPHPPRHDHGDGDGDGDGDGVMMRNLLTPVVKAVLREHYADLAAMGATLRTSALDWTVVRPPRLTGRPLTGSYRTAYGRNVRRGLTVSRADVAHLMLWALDHPDTIGQCLGVAAGGAR